MKTKTGNSVGWALRTLRESRQLTQEELAAAMGCTRQRVSLIERPDWNGTAQTIENALRALGSDWLELGVLMEGAGWAVCVDDKDDTYYAARIRYADSVQLLEEARPHVVASAPGLRKLAEKCRQARVALTVDIRPLED